MTDKQMRIKIAEACGWRGLPTRLELDGPVVEPDPPDYPNDLNACREMESSLEAYQRSMYQHFIDVVCHTDKDPHCSCWDFIHATARQRCEAFLRVKGLWTE